MNVRRNRIEVSRDEDKPTQRIIEKISAVFFSDDVSRLEPFYYYVPVLLGGFFPWNL